MIGGAHLFNGTKASLTADRFGRPLSALNLNGGFYQIPPGNYFPTGQFTITVWCKLRQYGNWPSIVTFANGFHFDTVFLCFHAASTLPHFSIYNGNISIASSYSANSTSVIDLNVWTHLAITFDRNLNHAIYINSNLEMIANSNKPLKNTTRIFNYVGRGDNFPGQPDIIGVIDELKIFNRAMTQKEIQFEMINNVY